MVFDSMYLDRRWRATSWLFEHWSLRSLKLDSLAMSNNHIFTKLVAGTLPQSQEFSAAQILIDSGFRPTELRGVVKNIKTGHILGRTLGSVWRAMYILLEGCDPEDAALAVGSSCSHPSISGLEGFAQQQSAACNAMIT